MVWRVQAAALQKAIVIDNGSDTCKAGFSGEDAPRGAEPQVPCLRSSRPDCVFHMIAQLARCLQPWSPPSWGGR